MSHHSRLLAGPLPVLTRGLRRIPQHHARGIPRRCRAATTSNDARRRCSRLRWGVRSGRTRWSGRGVATSLLRLCTRLCVGVWLRQGCRKKRLETCAWRHGTDLRCWRTACARRSSLGIRKQLDLTQEEFARRAGESQNACSQYEAGMRRPSLKIASALADTCALSLDYIYRGLHSGLLPRS